MSGPVGHPGQFRPKKRSVTKFLGLKQSPLEAMQIRLKHAADHGGYLSVNPQEAKLLHDRLCRLNLLETFLRASDTRSATALVDHTP